jgi:hypothetical protein
MSGSLTDKVRVLVSFGAADGGIEFAMQLRFDIYKKFGVNPATDPAFCYLDGDTLRVDPKTNYTYNAMTDTNMMDNPNWYNFYHAAMKSCGTMVLLITSGWLKSKWCFQELDMLVSLAAKKQNMRVLVVLWPDATALLQTGSWQDRHGGSQNRVGFLKRVNELPGRWIYHVSNAGASRAPGPGQVQRTDKKTNVTTAFGTNNFNFSCTEAERNLILAQISR